MRQSSADESPLHSRGIQLFTVNQVRCQLSIFWQRTVRLCHACATLVNLENLICDALKTKKQNLKLGKAKPATHNIMPRYGLSCKRSPMPTPNSCMNATKHSHNTQQAHICLLSQASYLPFALCCAMLFNSSSSARDNVRFARAGLGL
jgi:hypothetical protein